MRTHRSRFVVAACASLLATALAATVVRRASHAQSRIAGAGAIDAGAVDAGANDGALDASVPNDTAPRPRVPRGAWRPLEERSPLVGLAFAPVVDDGTRGRVVILWSREGSRGRPSGGTYEIVGNTIHVHDSRGHDDAITYDWTRGLHVQFGDVDERLARAPSVCNAARDCVVQEHTMATVECAQRVQWSCDRGEHRCLAHCGSPDRAPARQSCGQIWCPPHQVCCNSAAGVCTAPGEGCGQ